MCIMEKNRKRDDFTDGVWTGICVSLIFQAVVILMAISIVSL